MHIKFIKTNILFWIILFATTVSYTQNKQHNVHTELEKWKKSSSFESASWAFSAYNITKDSLIVSHNQQLRLVPASVLKLLTTGTMLEIAKDFRFKTIFGYKGIISETGVLHGDIIVKGFGDPTPGNPFFGSETALDSIFAQVHRKLKQLQISSINGNIIADASVFGFILQPHGYLWEDLGNHYGAGVSSLNFKENKLKITFQPGQSVGSPAQIIQTEFHPDTIEYINLVTTGARNTGDNAYVFGVPLQKKHIILGTIPSGRKEFDIYGANPNPPFSFGHALLTYLRMHGFSVSGSVHVKYTKDTQAENEFNEMYTHISPHISRIIQLINTESHNMSSESVLRCIGYIHKQQTDYKTAAESVKEIWKSAGIETSQLQIEDGSGLSRKNLLTTEFLITYLTSISTREYFKTFHNSLAIAGRTGTLANWFKDSVAENNLRAKTGSMSGIRSIAGYITNKNGELIAFACIINGHTMSTAQIKRNIETLVISLYD